MNIESVLIALAYAIGIVIVAVVFFRGILNPWRPPIGKPLPQLDPSAVNAVASPFDLPGKIFLYLQKLHDVLVDQENTKDSRVEKIGNAQVQLKAISKSLDQFLRAQGSAVANYGREDARIVENVATCLYTFLEQIKNEVRRTTLENTYPEAIVRLARAINGYFQGSYGLDRFVHELIGCKERIYLSLYRNAKPDKSVTERFISDFAPERLRLRKRADVVEYLSNLEKNWVANEDELRRLDPKCIMPLFTVRNVLRHCCKHLESRHATRNVDRISHYLADRSFNRLCFMGLTYDSQTVEATYREIFNTLDIMTTAESQR